VKVPIRVSTDKAGQVRQAVLVTTPEHLVGGRQQGRSLFLILIRGTKPTERTAIEDTHTPHRRSTGGAGFRQMSHFRRGDGCSCGHDAVQTSVETTPTSNRAQVVGAVVKSLQPSHVVRATIFPKEEGRARGPRDHCKVVGVTLRTSTRSAVLSKQTAHTIGRLARSTRRK
jgi:hypothetical protein